MLNYTMEDRSRHSDVVNFYTRPCTTVDYNRKLCARQLLRDFNQMYEYDINLVLNFFHGQYAKTHQALCKIMEEFNKLAPFDEKSKQNKPCLIRVKVENDQGETEMMVFSRMPALRNTKEFKHIPQSLQEEIDFVKREQQKDSNMAVVEQIDENTVECSCCFGGFDIALMAQCTDCHLICKECLSMYVKEMAYGSGKINLECLSSDCGMSYPISELQRCLDKTLVDKLQERGFMEDIKMAGVDDLISCPGCNFTATLSPTVKMFLCRNLDCQKAICRYCQVDWNDHEGLTCNEVETKDETALRKEYEEKMTKAKVRTCKDCKTEFLKEDGCNKLTCRCGVRMCYICRESSIDYTHFCGHFREPGRPCSKCKACSLWTNPEEDDQRAIEEIRKEAAEKQKHLGLDERIIGVPQTPKK
nr:E3 ubiquitin-protein ligase RNF216-like [Biomphalaria glabrata]